MVVEHTEKKTQPRPRLHKKKSRTERQLTPAGEARVGAFTIAGERYPVFLLDSPSIIEAYSSLDDVNLVKTADVGQILLVARQGVTAPPQGSVLAPAAAQALQQQLGPTGGAAPCAPAWESRDGLTPPMSDARARHFARMPVAPRDAVAAAEAAILKIACGSAPDGVTFEDVEEEYVAPSEDGSVPGGWRPVRRGNRAKPIAVAAAEIAKKKKEVKARARQAALAKGMTHTEARKAAVAAAARAAAALQSGYGGALAQGGGGGGGGGGGSDGGGGGGEGDDEEETGDDENDNDEFDDDRRGGAAGPSRGNREDI